MQGRTDSGNSRGNWAKVAVIAALLCLTALSLCACKMTDLFTAIILDPFAETPWEEAQTLRLNNPDASQESSFETSFDWTDESETSETVENLVVYSSDPNMDLTTHHTRFDYPSMFEGVEASDGVRLTFSGTALYEHSGDNANSQNPPEEHEEKSQGNDTDTDEVQSDNNNVTQEVETEEANKVEDTFGGENIDSEEGGAGSGEGSDGSGVGDESGGEGLEDEGKDEGEGDDGSADDPYAGYDGEVKMYDPTNRSTSKVQETDTLAVIGTDAAVLVQALGGKGAICAMSEYAYEGKDADGNGLGCASSFKKLFADQLSNNFEDRALLWKHDGSSPSDLKDLDDLIEACGQNGDIVYDQNIGNQESFFSDKQRKELYAAGTQLIPVDFSTVQGISDAAKAVGKALKKSELCKKNASEMADGYTSFLKNIVKSCGATHGGHYATGYASNDMFTTWNSCPLSESKAITYCCVATDSEAGVSYANPDSVFVDSRDVLLFYRRQSSKTPFSFWFQVSGLFPAGAEKSGLSIMWPFSQVYVCSLGDAGYFSSYSSNGPVSEWSSQSSPSNHICRMINQASTEYGKDQNGLGTANNPYLIVCDSDGKTAAEIKDALVEDILSYIDGGRITAYSALPLDPSILGSPTTMNSTYTSNMGYYQDDPDYSWHSHSDEWGDVYGNTFKKRHALADDCIRENPAGLLGSWTEGNMESVLEAAWLTGIFSVSPEGSGYDPENNLNDFNLTIEADGSSETIQGSDYNGNQKKLVKDVVEDFYKLFFDVDLSDSLYEKVIPDVGL